MLAFPSLALCSGLQSFGGRDTPNVQKLRRKWLRVPSHTYWGGQLRCGYGGAGVIQFHSTAQVKVTDFHWRHLKRKSRKQKSQTKETKGHEEEVKGDDVSAQSCGCHTEAQLYLSGHVVSPWVN